MSVSFRVGSPWLKKVFITKTPPAVMVVTVTGITGECCVAYNAEPGTTRPQIANANVAGTAPSRL